MSIVWPSFLWVIRYFYRCFGKLFFLLPSWLSSKESACNAGDLGSIPGLGRSPGEGSGNTLHQPCLENPHGQRSLEDYSVWGHKQSDVLSSWAQTDIGVYLQEVIDVGNSSSLSLFCSFSFFLTLLFSIIMISIDTTTL